MPDLLQIAPTAQNGFNLLNLIIAVAFSLIATLIGGMSSDARDRNYDSLKLANEAICRIYIAYATFYLAIFLLVTKAQPTSLWSWINVGMIALMLLIFVLSTRWIRRHNTDLAIAKRLGCPTLSCVRELGCVANPLSCRKEIQWSDIKLACGGNYQLAFWALIINVLISLSPITR